jgi:hypothetical protein
MSATRNHGVETPDQNLFTMRKNHSGPTLSVPEDEFLGDPEVPGAHRRMLIERQ